MILLQVNQNHPTSTILKSACEVALGNFVIIVVAISGRAHMRTTARAHNLDHDDWLG